MTVLTTQAADPGQADLAELVKSYADRSPRDAAIMALIEIAAFWQYQEWARAAIALGGFDVYAKLCCEAATALAEKEWFKESNVKEIIDRCVQERFRENFGYQI